MRATIDLMKEEIRAEIARGVEMDEVRDMNGDMIESHLPIYNNEIINEWRDMPSEYDDRGATELGHMGETSIVGLMSLDLYLYYTDLFDEACQEVETELEEEGGTR